MTAQAEICPHTGTTRCPFCLQTSTVRGYWIGNVFHPTHCLCGAVWEEKYTRPDYTRDRNKGAQGD